MKSTNRSIRLILASVCLYVSPASADETVKTEQMTYEQVAQLLKQPDTNASTKKAGFLRMKELAEQDHLAAIAGLAYLYQEGIGTVRDYVKAGKWLRMAAERGHAISMFNFAGLLVRDRIPLEDGETDRGRQYAEGVEWYRKAAESGLEEARVGYGIILMRGDYGSKPDPKKATTYLIPAAEGGHLEAMNALGTMYEIGNGVPYSVSTAETWFRKAAEKGHLKARSNLYRVLDAHPSGSPERRIEALAWLILAEQDGDVVAKKIFNVKTSGVSAANMALAREKAAQLRGMINEAKKQFSSLSK